MSEDPNAGSGPNYETPPYGTPPGSGSPYGASPEWPYGAPPLPPNNEIPPTRPLPLGEAIRQLPDQYIRVLTHPGTAVFAQEQGKAAWDIIWVQIILLSVVGALALLVQFNTTLPDSLANSNVPVQIIELLRTYSGAFALSNIVLMPLFFFIGAGIYQLIARAFGGRGTFIAYSYSSLLYAAPIAIVTNVLSIIVGLLGLPSAIASFLGMPLGIYSIVLRVFMTMAVHRLSGGKATWAVLLVPITVVVVSFVLGIVIAMAFVANHLR